MIIVLFWGLVTRVFWKESVKGGLGSQGDYLDFMSHET